MAAEQAWALVLRVIEFSESSCVVTLLTREFGKVRGLAKGARRPKSAFESALDLLSVCRVLFLRKSGDALDLLTEAKLERRFRPPGRDLACLYAAYYVAELINDLTDDHDPHPALFDAACWALDALQRPDAPVASIVLEFELQALRTLGHAPELSRCVECGCALPSGGRVAFGLLSGGTLCSECRPGKKQVVSLSVGAWRTLNRPTGAERELEAADRRTMGEVRGLMGQYIANLMGRRPRMHDYAARFTD